MTRREHPQSRQDATLLAVMAGRLEAAPYAPLYTFLGPRGNEADSADCEEVVRRAAGAADLLEAAGVGPGDRVLLVFPPDGLELVTSFFGCLLLGAIAVPVASPDPRHLAQELPKLRHIAMDSGARVALTHAKYRALTTMASVRDGVSRLLKGRPPDRERWPEVTWLLSDRIRRADAGAAATRLAHGARTQRPDDVVYLQYTSGSTSAPKGVVVRHRNLLHNLSLMARNTHVDAASVLVGWVPLFHDMGLAGGILNAMSAGARCVFFSPMSFLANPRLWLETIDRYGGTHIAGPNFGYEYVLRGLRNGDAFDLSTLRAALQGGESMRVTTMSRFEAAFGSMGFDAATFCNVYGMAEAVLFVTGQAGRRPSLLRGDRAIMDREGTLVAPAPGAPAVTLVGSGVPDAEMGVSVLAVNPATHRPRPDGVVGELWVSSPSVSTGYWGRREAENAAVFAARLSSDDGGEDPRRFLRTGDLGVIHEGEVFVCGRLKDLIIIGGRNIHPQDLEEAVVASDPILRPGNALAFGVEVDGTERVVVVAEVRRKLLERKDLPALLTRAIAAIRAAVAAHGGVQCHDVLLLRPDTIPKTTSGKLRRRECKERWADGSLHATNRRLGRPARTPAPPRGEAAPFADRPNAGGSEGRDAYLLRLLQTEVAAALHLADPDDVSVDRPLLDLGLDSLGLMDLGRRLEDRLGMAVPPASLSDASSLRALADLLLARFELPPDDEGRAHPSPHAVHAGDVPFTAGQLESLRLGQWSWWNRAALLTVHRPITPEQLHRAASVLVAHHHALRLRFHRDGDRFTQHYGDVDGSFAVESTSLTAPDEGTRRDALLRAMDVQHRRVDLERGPVLRLLLVEGLGPTQCLFVTINHLVMDAFTLGILVDELDHLCHLDEMERPLRLSRTSTRFEDYARWVNDFARGAAVDDLVFWQAQLDTPPPCAYDSRVQEPVRMADLASGGERFTEAETRALREVCTEGRRAPIATTLLAALVRTARGRWGCGRLTVKLSSSGRQAAVHGLDVSRTLGEMDCAFPLAVSHTASERPIETVAAVRDRLACVPSAGISFDALAHLNDDPAVRDRIASAPAPTLWFNFAGEVPSRSRPTGLFSVLEGPLGAMWDPRAGVKQPPLLVECSIVGGAARTHWFYSREHLGWSESEIDLWRARFREEVLALARAGTS